MRKIKILLLLIVLLPSLVFAISSKNAAIAYYSSRGPGAPSYSYGGVNCVAYTTLCMDCYSGADNWVVPEHLHIDSNYAGFSEPYCNFGEWGGENHCRGWAHCAQGYMNCGGEQDGCETSCEECSDASHCSAPDEVGYNSQCVTDGWCSICSAVPYCSLSNSDDVCPIPWNYDNAWSVGLTYLSYEGCNYTNDIDCDCPDGKMRCGEDCITPTCSTSSDCEDNLVCFNAGECNSQCLPPIDLGGGNTFLASTTQTLGDEEFDFVIFQLGDSIKLRIYNGDNIVSNDLHSGEYFTIGDQTYREFFSYEEDNEYISVFSVSFYTRLTYNIFPVCGNSVCETCESADNCLHYPPESCFSCPMDCPYVTETELDNYNNEFYSINGQLVGFNDILTDADLACEVKTQSAGALCNPLCVTHDFIDSNGCLFNRYTNSLPEYDNSTIYGEVNEPFTILFNGEAISVQNKTSNEGFLGLSPYGNADCEDGCECLSGNCDEGHCCPYGYEWGNTDNSANLICDGHGHVNNSYKTGLDLYHDEYTNIDYLSQTVGLYDDGTVDISNGVRYDDIVCTGADNCLDPICMYDSGEPIRENGVYQCRPEAESLTEETLREIKCTIHSHALARSTCHDRGIFNRCTDTDHIYRDYNPYLYPFCVTDNPNECARGECINELVGDTQVVLRTISLYDFCTTPNLVCSANHYMDNVQSLEGDIGGLVNYCGCEQNEVVNPAYGYIDVGYLIQVNQPMTVGTYCSVFGNDFERIMNIDAPNLWESDPNNPSLGGEPSDSATMMRYDNGTYFYVNYTKINHLPQIDEDAEEELYAQLFNYESCVEIFGEDMDFDCNDYTAVENIRKEVYEITIDGLHLTNEQSVHCPLHLCAPTIGWGLLSYNSYTANINDLVIESNSFFYTFDIRDITECGGVVSTRSPYYPNVHEGEECSYG